jgi:hypothetical protein
MITSPRPGQAPWQPLAMSDAEWVSMTGRRYPTTTTISSMSSGQYYSGTSGTQVSLSRTDWAVENIPNNYEYNYDGLLSATDAQLNGRLNADHGTGNYYAISHSNINGELQNYPFAQSNGAMVGGSGSSITYCDIYSEIDGYWPGDGLSPQNGNPSIIEYCRFHGPGFATYSGSPLANSNIPITTIGLQGTTQANLTEVELESITNVQASTYYSAGALLSDGGNHLYQVSTAGTSGSGTGLSAATVTASTNASGGSIASDTYAYQVAALWGAASSKQSVTTTGSSSVNTVSWTAVTGALGYNVYRQALSSGTWYVNTVSKTTTSIVDNGSNYTWSGSPQTALSPPSTSANQPWYQYWPGGTNGPAQTPFLNLISSDTSMPFPDGTNTLQLAYIGPVQHSDGIQMGRAESVIIRRNKISGFSNSCVIIQSSAAPYDSSQSPAGPVWITECDLQATDNTWVYVNTNSGDPNYAGTGNTSYAGRWLRNPTTGAWTAYTQPWLGRPEMITITDNLIRNRILGGLSPDIANQGLGGFINCAGSVFGVNGSSATDIHGNPIKGDYAVFVPDEATRQAGIAAQFQSDGVTIINSVLEQRFQYGIFPSACDARSWIVYARNIDQNGNEIFPQYTNRPGSSGFDNNGYYIGV